MDPKPFEQDEIVAAYFRDRFLAELIEHHDLKPKQTPTDNASRFAAYYGVSELPEEVARFLRLRDEYELVYQTLGEWRIFGSDVWLPDPEAGNLAEQVIALDQKNYLGTCMLEYASACIFLGTAGNGDAYFASLDPRFANAEIVFWNHETNDLEFSIADTLSSLAYANHLLEKCQNAEEDDEGTELDDIAESFERIQQRVRLSWHYESLEEVAEAEGEFEGNDAARYYFYRTLWIIYLLKNDGVHKLSAVKEVFGLLDHGKLELDKALESPYLAVLPQTAFYWLWRLFFFDNAEDLERVLAVTTPSPNPFVRDLSLLVEELQQGRKELGSIEDIHALRAAFIELDLDPARAEEREAERIEAERLAAEKRAADTARAAAMVAEHDDAALAELAWEHVGNEIIIDAIYARLRETDTELAEGLARADFYFDKGFERDGRYFRTEVDETLEVLAATGPARLAPLLITKGGHTFLPVAAQMAGQRVLPSVAPLLDARAEYNHELIAAVCAVGRARVTDEVPKLIAMLGEFAYDPGDYMSAIGNKELLWALCEALAEIGDERAVEPMIEIVASGHKDLMARTIVSLGRLGNPAAVDALIEQVTGPYSRPALYALARIGDERALAPMETLVDKRRGAISRLIYERVMLEALRDRCGHSTDLADTRFALGVVEASKYEAAELHETAIGTLAARLHGDELSALVRPFLDAEQRRVREAARHALGDAEVHNYDRAAVERLFADGGAAALAEALADPHGALRHNLAQKAIDAGVGGEIEHALITYARELFAFEHYTYAYTRDKWERKCRVFESITELNSDATDRLAYEAMTHPSCMVRGIFQYGDDDLKERVRAFGPMDPRKAQIPTTSAPRTVAAEKLGQARWSLGGMVNGLAFTPDGQKVIAVGGAGGSAGAAIVFDRDGDELRPLAEVRGWAYDVDIHPDGELAAVGLHAGHLLLIDIESGELLADMRGHGGVPNGVRKVRFSPDGKRLASASDDQSLIIWDVEERKVLRRVSDKFDVNTVDWFPDGERVVFGTDKQVGIVTVADEDADIPRLDVGGVAEVRVFAAGSRIAIGGQSKKGLLIVDDALEIQSALDQRHAARIRLSRDESTLFAVSWEGERLVQRWDLASGESTHLPGHDDAALFALDLDPQTGTPYAGGKKNVVASWDANGAARDAGSGGHGGEVEQILALGDDQIISAADDGSVFRWSLQQGAMLAKYEAAESVRASAIALSPDRKTLLVTGFDGAVAFDVDEGRELWKQTELERSEIAFGLADTFVVGSGENLLWLDANTGAITHTEHIDDDSWLNHLLPISPSRAVVAAYRTPRLHMFDLEARAEVEHVDLPTRAEKAETYGIGLGGGKLVVSRWDRSFDLLDAETLAHRFEVAALSANAPVAVSPDGSLAAVGEHRLRLLDTETFDTVADEALGHNISAMVFLDANTLVAGLDSGQLVKVTIGSD